MTRKSFAIVPRSRFMAAALMYGLSLTVRLTSATGEEADVAVQTERCRADPTSLHFNDRPAAPALPAAVGSPKGRSCPGCERLNCPAAP